MRLKKNVLRLLSCVAVMAAMVMLLLTGGTFFSGRI